MSKYYYIAIGGVVILVVIALTVLSQIDKNILSSSPTPPDSTLSKSTDELSKEPYHRRSSKPQEEKLPAFSPAAKEMLTEEKIPEPPSLNLRLVGTTVFGEKSSVILEDLLKGTRGVYRLGDIVKGFTITTILSDSTTLTKEEQEVILTLSKGGDMFPSGDFVKKIDDNSWLVSADKVTDMVSDIDQYVGQVVAFQHFENGQPAGFRIRHLKEGNDFEVLGIQNEDVIKKVNGLEINDLSDSLKALYQLSNETTFEMEVERNNNTTTLNYQLDKSVNPLVPIISNLIKLPQGRKN